MHRFSIGALTPLLLAFTSLAGAAEPTPPATLPTPPVTLPEPPAPPSCADNTPAVEPCPDGACCKPKGEFIGGVGLYVLRPYFSNNPAISFFNQGTGPGVRDDIRSRTAVAPQVWLGYQDASGLGIRGRWWYLSQGTSQSYNPVAPEGGTLTVLSAAPLGSFIIQDDPRAFTVTSKLQLQVADLELTQTAALGCWNFLFAGGLTYADIKQNYNAYAVAADGTPVKPLISHTSFVGLGPVLALEARRPLMDCGLSLYGSARSRLLFGNARQTAVGGDELVGTQQSQQQSVVSIEELELGLEFSRTIGSRRFFGQVALVGQEWFGAGNSTRSSRSGPPTTIPNFSTEDTSSFGLLGLSIRLGVEF